MRTAVYSDIHGDLEALQKAYALALRLGCSAHLCCGDFVDEAHPADGIIMFLMEHEIRCVRGNHERWLLASLREARYRFNLSRAAVGFLEALPPHLNLELQGVLVAIHHARPGSDMAGLYETDLSMAGLPELLEEGACDVLLVGHTHEAFVAKHPGGGLVANPGALGRPPFVQRNRVAIIGADGVAREPSNGLGRTGTFGVLEVRERRFEVLSLDGTRVLGDLSG